MSQAEAARSPAGAFSGFERMVAWRYLRSRRKETVISVIASISFLGIMLGVATLIVVMAVIFLLAWPLEWVPIVLIFVPIMLPIIKELKIDLTWFGILVAVNLQTAWLSPPVALSAYFLKGVAPQWQLADIYKGMMQFMVLQLTGLVFVMIFPQLALWLPGVLYTR